jgi:hypothetical protein
MVSGSEYGEGIDLESPIRDVSKKKRILIKKKLTMLIKAVEELTNIPNSRRKMCLMNEDFFMVLIQ